jgi:prophage antirepressor-like protein
MRYLIQNEENNPLTKGQALRQIKKILGVEKNWQVLSNYRVIPKGEILSFENMCMDITEAAEFSQCANINSIAKVEKKSNKDLGERLFTFSPSDQIIRVEIINDELWFIAKDVCDVLGHTNVRVAVQMLDDDETDVRKVYVKSENGVQQQREMHIINESGLYNLIFRSNKSEAKVFRKWITSEVLPTLRKTGEYQIKKRNHNASLPAGSDTAQLLQLIADNLQKNDKAAIAARLGVARSSVSNILSGKTKSGIILQALYEKALENKRNGFINAYSSNFVTTAINKLIGQ